MVSHICVLDYVGFDQMAAALSNRAERLSAEQERQRQLEAIRLEWVKAAAHLAQRAAEVEVELQYDCALEDPSDHLDPTHELQPVDAGG